MTTETAMVGLPTPEENFRWAKEEMDRYLEKLKGREPNLNDPEYVRLRDNLQDADQNDRSAPKEKNEMERFLKERQKEDLLNRLLAELEGEKISIEEKAETIDDNSRLIDRLQIINQAIGGIRRGTTEEAIRYLEEKLKDELYMANTLRFPSNIKHLPEGHPDREEYIKPIKKNIDKIRKQIEILQ